MKHHGHHRRLYAVNGAASSSSPSLHWVTREERSVKEYYEGTININLDKSSSSRKPQAA